MTMNRAYSLLEVKSIDEGKRQISGIATTPETDRQGDVVDSMGATFANPLALLWMHQSDKPVGQATFGKATAKGIPFTATIESLEEPGTLKDRLDEAWQSVKLRLVRGVSIGFRAIEYAFMDGGGIHFIKTEILELSLVSIPANASATINSIKSIDRQQRAASGQIVAKTVRLDSPGASGITRKPKPQEGKDMNVQEQIKSFDTTRKAKADQMDAIMAKAGESGETLDAEQSQQYDDLAADVATVDKHLERLRKHEQSVSVKAVAAAPVEKGGDGAAAARGGANVIAVAKKEEPGVAFARFVGCLAHGKGNMRDAIEFATARFPEEKPLHGVMKALITMSPADMLLKTAVAAGTTSDSTWAAPLVQYNQMSTDFIEFLRPQTIVGKIRGLRMVPFNIRMPRQTTGGTAYWVGENKVKPVTKFAFDNVTLKWTKLATIAVITDELARFSAPNAELIIRDQLAKAVIQQQDADFVDPSNAGTTDIKPQSITNSVNGIVSLGGDEVDVRKDIQAIFAPFIAANITPANGVWIMSATTALGLSLMVNSLGQPSFPGITMQGGTFWGMPVIVSETSVLANSTGNFVILANASDILLADDGQVTIDVSNQVSLQMNDAPDDPVSASSVLVSTWQQNLIAIRAERYINWVKARAESVQFLQGVNWGTSSS